MFLIPYKMETIFTRFPIANAIIIVITALMFFFTAFGFVDDSVFESLVLQDWALAQMTGSALLHGGLFHLLGNMLFLWIFGNAVCATIGNIAYPFLYALLAVFASAAHLMFDGNPAIGASGAVNGIVGMALIIYPLNKLHCAYGFSMPMMGIFWKSGKFSTKSFWMILLWLAFDILGVVTGGGGTAYWAHLGGFAFGMTIGLMLVLFEAVETYDPTLMDIVTGKKLEHQTYDLQELAARTGEVKYITPSESTSDSKALTSDVSVGQGKEPSPVLRVTSVIKKQNVITCFFFNDGDPIKELSVQSDMSVIAEINPARSLERRVNGVLRLKNADNENLRDIKLSISYAVGNRRITKRLVYHEEEKRFTVSEPDPLAG